MNDSTTEAATSETSPLRCAREARQSCRYSNVMLPPVVLTDRAFPPPFSVWLMFSIRLRPFVFSRKGARTMPPIVLASIESARFLAIATLMLPPFVFRTLSLSGCFEIAA